MRCLGLSRFLCVSSAYVPHTLMLYAVFRHSMVPGRTLWRAFIDLCIVLSDAKADAALSFFLAFLLLAFVLCSSMSSLTATLIGVFFITAALFTWTYWEPVGRKGVMWLGAFS